MTLRPSNPREAAKRQREWRRESARRYEDSLRDDPGVRKVRDLGSNRERKAKRRARDFGAKRDWIVTLPCLVCGRTPSDPHHEPPRSRGGTKKDLVSLCPDHHTLAPDSRHRLGSVERFAREHGVDLIAEAERIENAWRSQCED